MDEALQQISEAERLLVMASTPIEAASVADIAAAAATYAKRAKMAVPTINKAVELKIRAERLAGSMLAGMEKAKNHKSSADTLSGLGISHKQSSRWQKVAGVPEEAFQGYIGKCNETGRELTSSAVYKLAKKEDAAKPAEPAAPVEGAFTVFDELTGSGQKFGTIYADPPWQYSNQGTRASTDNHYSTMTVEDICSMPVGELAADQCHLHLWTTNAFLFECPKIFEAWGFEFKSTFVWVKPQMGIGNYWRNSHEILLLAIKGGQRSISKAEKSWLECPRGLHSAKPDRIRDSIMRLSPGPYLELFGRRQIEGWTVFGNQIERELYDAE